MIHSEEFIHQDQSDIHRKANGVNNRNSGGDKMVRSTRGFTIYDILGNRLGNKVRSRLINKLTYKYGYTLQDIKLAPHPRAIKK